MKKMMKNEQENEACEGKEEGDEEEMEREKRGEKGWIDHLMTRREIRLVMKRGRHIPLSTITVSTDYAETEKEIWRLRRNGDDEDEEIERE
uniref:Uncharacterized protein n=1 Tax=Pristionchus pacificus TaxID=54126 RepID=A0A2A6CZB9_PRIPA|eukprot:PDM83574.1 hypothetical protein PRIPAC_30061 [Pristionchus pacificus]